MTRRSIVCISAAAAVIAGGLLPGQEDEGVARTRGMWNQAFLERRPQKVAAAGGAVQTAVKTPPATVSSVQRLNQDRKAPVEMARLGTGFVGVTLWKMSLNRGPGGSGGVRFRGLEHPEEDPGGTQDWIPERVALESAFQQRDMVRLSVESAREGYLYVIDRDVYADGTMGPPTLIFPTARLRGGENRIRPGVPVEMPDPGDKPPVFVMKKSRADQVGIKLMMIVAPEPIREVRVGRRAQRLDPEKAAEWEKKWGQQVEFIEDPKMIGKVYSAVEQEAGNGSGGAALAEDDPLPTTLFRTEAAENQPMLVNVTLAMK